MSFNNQLVPYVVHAGNVYLFLVESPPPVEFVGELQQMFGDVKPKQIHEMTGKAKFQRQICRVAPRNRLLLRTRSRATSATTAQRRRIRYLIRWLKIRSSCHAIVIPLSRHYHAIVNLSCHCLAIVNFSFHLSRHRHVIHHVIIMSMTYHCHINDVSLSCCHAIYVIGMSPQRTWSS